MNTTNTAGTVKSVVVVGGGLVGTAVARALRLRGADVVVVERGVPGAEASWAAGGILSPQAECDVDGPMLRLCLEGLATTLSWCRALGDVGLRTTGTLDVAVTDDEARALQERVRWQQALSLEARWLEPAAVRALAPIDNVRGAAFFAGEASLEPRRFFDALRASATTMGVRFATGRRVTSVSPRRVDLADDLADDLDDDRDDADGSGARSHIDGDAVVVCAGAWTPQVQGAGVDDGAVYPVRGQMVELLGDIVDAPVLYGHGGYAVPRGDGRVVVGSTMERAGFEKRLTAGGLLQVLATATSLLPSLAQAPVTSTWAGLRPATPDGLPLLGRSSTGVWIASGHFRNGVLLAAVSAERIAAALVDGVAIDARFDPSRSVSRSA